MRRTYKTLLAFLSAQIAFTIFYLISIIYEIPLLRYFPIDRKWSFDPAGGISMDWYGRTGVALLCGLAAALLSLAVCRSTKLASIFEKESFLRAVGAMGGILLVVTFSYYAHVLWVRDLIAPTPPSWYCPR